jgi:glycerol transport system ATP-binding protein
MYEGEVVQVGKPQDLFETPDHTFVGYFIGSPGMNVLPATIDGTTALIDGQALPLGRAPQCAADARIEIGIRPEFLIPTVSGGLAARVIRVEDIGRLKILRCESGKHRIAAILPEEAPVPDGEIRLSADPRHIHVYANSRRVV